jgi:hypothetical protein
MSVCIQVTGSLSGEITVGTLQVKNGWHKIKTAVCWVSLKLLDVCVAYNALSNCADVSSLCAMHVTSRHDNVLCALDYFRQQRRFQNRVFGIFPLQQNRTHKRRGIIQLSVALLQLSQKLLACDATSAAGGRTYTVHLARYC